MFVLAMAAAVPAVGCHADYGHDTRTRTAAADRVYQRHQARVGDFDSSAGARSMGLSSEMGVYDGSDVEDVIRERVADVRGCYERAGHARRYAGGKVMLRFEVDAGGKPTDVLMIENTLGNRDVERCLYEVAMDLRFPPPIGNKAATFEYPFEFKSTRELPVTDVDPKRVGRDVNGHLAGLASCGKVSEGATEAVFYIEPSGRVGSAGLQSQTHVDAPAADCVVQQILKWKLAAAPGRALRCHATLPPTLIASSEIGPRRGTSR